MKKIIAVVLLLCLALPGLALEARESLVLTLEGGAFALDFDKSEEYSGVQDGLVRAAFYAYADDGDHLYELTMIFPEDVGAGSVIDTQYAKDNRSDASVAAIFSTSQEAVYYFAGATDGAAYPEGARFAITFDAVEPAEGGTHYAGHLDAYMVGMNMYSESDVRQLEIADAPFSFTMPAPSRGDAFDASPAPDAPTPSPSPTPTREAIAV